MSMPDFVNTLTNLGTSSTPNNSIVSSETSVSNQYENTMANLVGSSSYNSTSHDFINSSEPRLKVGENVIV